VGQIRCERPRDLFAAIEQREIIQPGRSLFHEATFREFGMNANDVRSKAAHERG
jgi:hypothetical protein